MAFFSCGIAFTLLTRSPMPALPVCSQLGQSISRKHASIDVGRLALQTPSCLTSHLSRFCVGLSVTDASNQPAIFTTNSPDDRSCQGPAVCQSYCSASRIVWSHDDRSCQGLAACQSRRSALRIVSNPIRTLVPRTSSRSFGDQHVISACHIRDSQTWPWHAIRCRSVGEPSLYPNLRKV